jgi:hypothetical protein
MKVIINEQVYDSKSFPIAFVFDNDSEKESVVSHLSNMQPKEGIRIYTIYPDDCEHHNHFKKVIELAIESYKK